MRKSIAAVLAGLCCMAGCRVQPAAPNVSEQTKPDGVPAIKRLLSRTDIVVIRHFYSEKDFAESPSHRAYVTDGSAKMQPIWAYEPGKQANGSKGARIKVTPAFVDHSTHSASFLDESELHDLSSALEFMDGALKRGDSPGEYVETEFISKDAFKVTAFHMGDGKGMVSIESSGDEITFASDRLSEFRNDVSGVLTSLEAAK